MTHIQRQALLGPWKDACCWSATSLHIPSSCAGSRMCEWRLRIKCLRGLLVRSRSAVSASAHRRSLCPLGAYPPAMNSARDALAGIATWLFRPISATWYFVGPTAESKVRTANQPGRTANPSPASLPCSPHTEGSSTPVGAFCSAPPWGLGLRVDTSPCSCCPQFGTAARAPEQASS